RRTPAPLPPPTRRDADPDATEPYTPAELVGEPTDVTDYSNALAAPPARPAKKPRTPEPFDWTPIILIAVVILSAVIGYVVLTQ
ncbi:MAG TPA: hypothetical protein VM529_18855, partial [Gemmata sp.]|nr:hypothetical protein [Gemmata sp.]